MRVDCYIYVDLIILKVCGRIQTVRPSHIYPSYLRVSYKDHRVIFFFFFFNRATGVRRDEKVGESRKNNVNKLRRRLFVESLFPEVGILFTLLFI